MLHPQTLTISEVSQTDEQWNSEGKKQTQSHSHNNTFQKNIFFLFKKESQFSVLKQKSMETRK